MPWLSNPLNLEWLNIGLGVFHVKPPPHSDHDWEVRLAGCSPPRLLDLLQPSLLARRRACGELSERLMREPEEGAEQGMDGDKE
jgi:hypothetical protein